MMIEVRKKVRLCDFYDFCNYMKSEYNVDDKDIILTPYMKELLEYNSKSFGNLSIRMTPEMATYFKLREVEPFFIDKPE